MAGEDTAGYAPAKAPAKASASRDAGGKSAGTGRPKKADAPKLPAGTNYKGIAGSYGITVDMVWFRDGATHNGIWLNPPKMRELLEHLRSMGMLPWASDEGLAAAAQAIGIAAHEDDTVKTTYLGASVFGYVGLPPNAPAMVSPEAIGLRVALVFDTSSISSTEIIAQGETTKEVLRALEGYTGLAALPGASVLQIPMNVGDHAVQVLLQHKDLGSVVFDADEYETWRTRAKREEAKNESAHAAQQVGVHLTADEAAFLTQWLEDNSMESSGSLKTRELLAVARQIEASEYRGTILAELQRDKSKYEKLDAEDLRRLIHKVTFEQQRKGFGDASREPDDIATDDAIIDAELPAKVVSKGGLVAAGDDVTFEVVIDWDRFPMGSQSRERFMKRAWKVQIDWIFERGDLREIERTDAPAVTHKLTLPLGTKQGVWTVHAFVRTSHFWPTRMEPVQVEVKPASRRMSELKEEALGYKDADIGLVSEDHKFDGKKDETIGDLLDGWMPGLSPIMGTDHDFEGTKHTGLYYFDQKTNTERAAERETEIQNLEATLKYLRSQPGKWNDAIEAAEASLAKRREEQKLLSTAEANETPFEVRATYFSRTESVSSGPLQIYGTCRIARLPDGTAAIWYLTLRDTSRRFDAELLTIEGPGGNFDQAIELAFVTLCSKYPAGRIAFFAQKVQDHGPTNELIGFELDTTSPGKKLREVGSSMATTMAVGVLSMFAMMFPPAIPLVIGITTLHGLVTTMDQLDELESSGRLTDGRRTLGILSFALTLLPGIRMATPLSAGRGALFALAVVDHGGNFLLFVADVKERIETIEATQVGELAELYAELVRIQATTHESDPRRAELRAEFDVRARSVRDAFHQALTEATEGNILVMVPGAVMDGAQLGSGHSRHAPDGDDDTVSRRHDDNGVAHDYDVSHVGEKPNPHPETSTSEHVEPHKAPVREPAQRPHAEEHRQTEAEKIIELVSTPAPEDPLRRPGAIDRTSNVEHLGEQIATGVGGGEYGGHGVFVLDIGGERVAVRIERTSKQARIRRRGDEIILEIPKGIAGAELERIAVAKLTEARHQELRRHRGMKATADSALGPNGDGGTLSPADMAAVAELRVLERQRQAQLDRGPEWADAAEAIKHQIDKLETKLGLNDGTPEGMRRRNVVETQIAVQNDLARRSAAAKKLEGAHGHPGIELHTHFMGIVKAEVFRDRAAAAKEGADPSSWIPLLEKIAALKGLDFEHEHNPDGTIDHRAAAGDAVIIAGETLDQVKTLLKRAANEPAEAAAYLRAAEILAEDACQAALGATTETDFNSSYEVRDALVKSTFSSKQADGTRDKQAAYDDFIREAILELARDGIGYVEASSSIKKLREVLHPQRIREVMEQLIKEGKIVPGQVDIRMLGMVLTGHFGDRRPDLEPVRKPNGLDSELEENREQVRKEPGSVGGDIGGPENVDWNSLSSREFADMYIKYARLAKESGHPFVFRPHVGEGSVDPKTGKPFSTEKDRVVDPDTGELPLVARARNNIERFVTGLEIARSEGKLDTGKVIVRMGHVTHATPDQIKRMVQLGVIAEVNLGSNIATGVVSQTKGPNGPRLDHETLEGHSFPTLIYYGVRIAISTDAGPVMQTTLRQEFVRAKQQIEDVLAGSRAIRVSADDAFDAQTGTHRGTPVANRPGEYDLTITNLNPAELSRFAHGYEKLYADAESYYKQRPKPDGATGQSVHGGDHHVDLAGEHGLVGGRGGGFVREGVRKDVETAANGYAAVGYAVVRQELDDGVLVVAVTSADQTFTMTLRSWRTGGDAHQAAPDAAAGAGAMRAWYDAQLERIRALDAAWTSESVSLGERARRAFELRRLAREQAGEAIQVASDYDAPSFEALVNRLSADGKTADQIFTGIIRDAVGGDASYPPAPARKKDD